MKILCAVTHDGIRNGLAALLRDVCGYEVKAVGSGNDAWQVLQSNEDQSDVTIVFLGGGWGLPFLKVVKANKRYSSMEVIVIADPVARDTISKAGGIPADEYSLSESVMAALEDVSRRS